MSDTQTKGQKVIAEGLPSVDAPPPPPPVPMKMRGRRAVAPDGPVSPVEPQTPATPTPATAAELLRAYVAYREAQIYRPRLGGQIGGTSMVAAAAVSAILRELEEIASWLEQGQPGAAARLSPDDLKFWLNAREHDLEIPDDVERALPPRVG
jgi:hypothetical protein